MNKCRVLQPDITWRRLNGMSPSNFSFPSSGHLVEEKVEIMLELKRIEVTKRTRSSESTKQDLFDILRQSASTERTWVWTRSYAHVL